MGDEYEIEPVTWIGAPIPPRPEFVPWKGTLKPGQYYSHTAGMWEPEPPDIRSFYKEGLRVKEEPGGKFRPTARVYNITPEMLAKHPNNEILRRIGNWQGVDTRGGTHARPSKGQPFTKVPPSQNIAGTQMPPPRAGKTSPLEIVGRLPKQGFNPANPAYTTIPGTKIETSARGWFGHGVGSHTGHINPKTIEAHFPKGSNVPMTRPSGLFTGRGPMLKSAGLIGLMLGFPNMQPPPIKSWAEEQGLPPKYWDEG